MEIDTRYAMCNRMNEDGAHRAPLSHVQARKTLVEGPDGHGGKSS
jgi:hypothetical protein